LTIGFSLGFKFGSVSEVHVNKPERVR